MPLGEWDGADDHPDHRAEDNQVEDRQHGDAAGRRNLATPTLANIASQDSMLLQLWPVTEGLTTIALAQDQATRDDPKRAHRVHRDLIEAVLSPDLPRIEHELARHTLGSAEELVAFHEHCASDRRPDSQG